MSELALRKPHFEFEKPNEGYSVAIDWVFGNDSFTKSLGQKLKFSVSDVDLEHASKIATRDKQELETITDVWGRSAKAKSKQPDMIMNHNYETLELNGFGVQKTLFSNASTGSISPASPIGLPNAENFAEANPKVTHTKIYDGEKEITLGDPYSFTGAYTAKQIAHKCAANLFFLNKLSNMEKPPFIVPIPLAIGHYPTIMNNEGEFAYFGIFKVPYGGQRTGSRLIASRDVESIAVYSIDALNSMPNIASALATISNVWGLTHNQPHPSNMQIPKKGEGTLPLLADFSTVYPLRLKKQEYARARELTRGIHSAWNVMLALWKDSNEDKITSEILKRTVENYIGHNIHLPFPNKMRFVEPFLIELFRTQLENGIIPKVSGEESWEKILALEKIVMKDIKKNLKIAH